MTASERAALRQGGWLPDLGATLVPQQVSVGPGKVEGEGGVGWVWEARSPRPEQAWAWWHWEPARLWSPGLARGAPTIASEPPGGPSLGKRELPFP